MTSPNNGMMSQRQEQREPTNPASRSRALWALVLLVPVPSLGVFIAMIWPPTQGTALGQIIYASAKIWIVAFPLMWRIIIERQRPSLSPMKHGGLSIGILLGVMIAVAIVAGYWLVGRRVIDVDALRAEAADNALNVPARYIGLALMLTLVNSLLEEYVWRWFVYRQCERLMPPGVAIISSAFLFTLHHIVALRAQMDWAPTLLACGGIFVGGCAWSWLYRRYRSIWPGYASHILADAAVFGIGWLLIFGKG